MEKAAFAFCLEGNPVACTYFGSGHINSTIKVTTDCHREYVLQKINKYVFKNPVAVMQNAAAVTAYIRDAEGKVVSNLIRTKVAPWRDLWPGTGKYCYLDIPVMPTELGEYTLDVYFNGATVLTKSFSVSSGIG